jgi:hypothetical protein
MCQLRSGSHRSSILDRGAEDCEEGSQGVSAKEALKDDLNMVALGV